MFDWYAMKPRNVAKKEGESIKPPESIKNHVISK